MALYGSKNHITSQRIKIPITVFTEIEKHNHKIHMESQRPETLYILSSSELKESLEVSQCLVSIYILQSQRNTNSVHGIDTAAYMYIHGIKQRTQK